MWSPCAWLTMTASMVPGIGGWRSLESMPKSSSTRTPPCSTRYAEAPRPPPPRMVTRAGGAATARCSSSGAAKSGTASSPVSRPGAGALGDLRRRSLRRCRRRGGTAGGGPARDGGGRLQQERVALGRRLQPPRGGRSDVPRRAQQVVLRHRRVALALGLRAHARWSPRGTPSARPPRRRAPARRAGAGLGGARCREGRAASALGLLHAPGGLALGGLQASQRRAVGAGRDAGLELRDAVLLLLVQRRQLAARLAVRLALLAELAVLLVGLLLQAREVRGEPVALACAGAPAPRRARRPRRGGAVARPRPGRAPGAAPARPTRRSGSPPASALETGVPLTSMDSATRSMPLWPTSSSSGSSSSDGARTPPRWSTTRSRPSCQTNGVRRASCGKESSPSASPSFRRASSGTHGGAFRACGDRRFARWAIIERYPGSSHRRGVGATGNSGTVAACRRSSRGPEADAPCPSSGCAPSSRWSTRWPSGWPSRRSARSRRSWSAAAWPSPSTPTSSGSSIPTLHGRDLDRALIADRRWRGAAMGAVSALPGIVPGAGTSVEVVAASRRRAEHHVPAGRARARALTTCTAATSATRTARSSTSCSSSASRPE